MALSDNKTLRGQAARGIALCGDARKIVMLHTAVTVGVSLLTLLLDLVLSQEIDKATGLAGLGSRGILETLQQLLLLANMIALPFWELGIRYFGLRVARSEPVSTRDLTEGFRRFGPALRLMLLRTMLMLVLGFICVYIASAIVSLTPYADPVKEAMMPLVDQMMADPYMTMPDPMTIMESVPEEALMAMTEALLVVLGILMAIVCLPVLYLFRLADLAVLDMPGTGAVLAMVKSFRAIRRHPMRMLKLDFGFWWYYLLQALCTVLAYADVIVGALGITLPFSATAAYIITAVLNAAGTFALFTFARGQVETTYALAYNEVTTQ